MVWVRIWILTSNQKNRLLDPVKGNKSSHEKPRIGQGRAGMRRRRHPPINQTITPASELSKKILEVSKIENKIITHQDFITPVHTVNSPSLEAINRKPMIRSNPFYSDPAYRPPHKPIRIPMSEGQENVDISPEINIDFDTNSPFQGVISETYQRPNKSFFQEP